MGTCSLRSQLLLALCESPGGDRPDGVAHHDRVLALAREVDACVRDGCFEPARLGAAERCTDALLAAAKAAAQAHAARPARQVIKLAGVIVGGGEDSDGGESGVGRGDGACAALADAAMVLRDPPVLHLLAHEAVRTLEGCVERQADPGDDPRLGALSKLIAIATGARDALQRLPGGGGGGGSAAGVVDACRLVVPRVMATFFPRLAEAIAEAQLRDSDNEDEPVPGDDVDGGLVALLQQDAVARKVATAFVLRRLADNDAASATALLRACAAALCGPRPGSGVPLVGDEAPFTATLARALQAHAQQGTLTPNSDLWTAAVDGVLLQASAVHPTVHDEVRCWCLGLVDGAALGPLERGQLLLLVWLLAGRSLAAHATPAAGAAPHWHRRPRHASAAAGRVPGGHAVAHQAQPAPGEAPARPGGC